MAQQFLRASTERVLTPAPRPAVSRFPPRNSSLPPPLLQLQRTLGNRRVAQLIQSKRLTPQGRLTKVQPKLVVGAANNAYEQEADRVSGEVMSMPDATASNATESLASQDEDKDKTLQTMPLTPLSASITPFSTTPATQRQMESTEEPEEQEAPVQAKRGGTEMGLQRQPEMDEEEKKPIQAKNAGPGMESFEAGDEVEPRLDRSKGGGSPLPEPVLAYMEPRFGMEFSHVRMHTGSESIQMNRDVGAKAFTHGSDIYYGADSSPTDLALTAHELTHVVQQTGSAPLQAKRLNSSSSGHAGPSIHRACTACEGRKDKKDEDQALAGRLQAKPSTGSGNDGNSVQRSLGSPNIIGRTGAPVVQRAWALTETVSNTKPIIGDRTRENGSTMAVPGPTGVYGKASAWQKAGFWQIYGGNAHLVMRRDTRYTFVHTGADNNLLTLRGGASIFGGAEADDLHYGQAGAAIAGNIAVRTLADLEPKQKSLFPPIHDGGRSEAKKSSIGEVDVSLPVGDATVDVNIPLTKTDEGELATLSESMPFNHDVAGGSDWKSVDVYLVAYIELAADIENEFWGTDGDVNWAHAAAQYSLTWQERPVPAVPDEEGEEGEILVKRRCWSGRDCDGKAYNQKFSHCHNCKNYASGKSLGEPGNCERC
ncbi:MAG: DUF4157 domain-containing protein [Nitrosospira sp.]|nr:DUF4157 domain-containing protein [Nitrosospira sp.]